jgi:S-adenosylmethionine decarboxylase proenzyme
MNGLHILAEFHHCAGSGQLLTSAEALALLCRETCRAAGLTPVAEAFHQFQGATAEGGATGAIVLAESHLAIHTWPEMDGVTLDLYVCNFSQDNRAAAEQVFAALCREFLPRDITRRDIVRGQLAPIGE